MSATPLLCRPFMIFTSLHLPQYSSPGKMRHCHALHCVPIRNRTSAYITYTNVRKGFLCEFFFSSLFSLTVHSGGRGGGGHGWSLAKGGHRRDGMGR